MVIIRASVMRRLGIRAIVFGNTDKSDFLLVPPVLAIVYAVLANAFKLPMLNVLIQPFWLSSAPGWAGLAFCVISVIGIGLTLASFGNSFRVGIDENNPAKLITGGMFAISRNPIYVCFLLFLCGLLIIHRNIIVAVMAVIFAWAIHRQIIREEKFLADHYGEEYGAYKKKVRRYL